MIESRKRKTVRIDEDAIRRWSKENKISLNKIGLAMGRSGSFIGYVLRKGCMKENAYNILLNVLDLPDGSFIARDPEQKNKDAVDGYQIALDAKPDRVRICLNFQGQELYSAWAYVKEQTEFGLVQAISYAAHLMYKQAEQDVLKT